ncbi:MAG: DUF4331 domain-containing protein [Terrimonas sp.]|nr:DUF4331 domain-containing protein [Terrimonas sp.]
MKNLNRTFFALSLGAISLISCKKDKQEDNFDTAGTYVQVDQMGRPAINTVFVNSARKNEFNTTIPTAMNAAFNAQFQTVLSGFGYTTNILSLDKASFAGVLATDVLNVSMNGTTSFYDGTNVLTGRALSDDVITTELTLIFGGADGAQNPGLSDDHVDANDKAFLASFPYLASPW